MHVADISELNVHVHVHMHCDVNRSEQGQTYAHTRDFHTWKIIKKAHRERADHE